MTAMNEILTLQKAQLRHDEAFHQDILVLETSRRAKHMALHNAKYTGRFVAAIEDGDNDLFEQTLTDAFIISLATANTFSQDLRSSLPVEDDKGRRLNEIGALISASTKNRSSFIRSYAHHTGCMAKACESLDHLEDFSFRPQLMQSNAGIFSSILAEAEARQIDISEAYSRRIADVETKSPRGFLL